ncbi:phosphotransferase [Priestia megaterium]|nr:phosphotransferase [Priestia megaterium]
MNERKTDKKFEQLIKKVDSKSRLLRVWELKGGVSAQVTGLEILLGNGQKQKLVVRQYGNADIQENSNVAFDEFALLEILKSADIPVPAPYCFDQSSEIFSSYIVIEFIDGCTECCSSKLTNVTFQLAAVLAKAHRLDCSKLNVSFLAKQEERVAKKLSNRPVVLDESLDEGVIRTALTAVWPLSERNKKTIVHGDFWPGNVLWKGEEIAAVIDWEDAALGEPLADLSNARLEILWAFGQEAMNDFTDQYQSLMPEIDYSHLPYWDLVAALRPASQLSLWGLEKAQKQMMRDRHKYFVTEALGKLPRQI